MQVLEGKPWRYSHTQLAMWKRCKRLYHDAYILGHKEPKTANMAAGTWLAQNPIEHWEGRQDGGPMTKMSDESYWQSIWANFLAEFGGDNTFDDPIFTLGLAKRILAAYKANPVQGKVVEIEHTYEKEFPGGYLYTSRPDLVSEKWEHRTSIYEADQPHIRTTWDIKLKTFNQNRAGETFFVKPELSPFDDQCLGQAILSGADAFGQIQFWVGKKDGAVTGPIYVEQAVNPVLAKEWEWETLREIIDIDGWKIANELVGNPFPKNPASCHAFGKDCHRLAACGFGFERSANANSSAS